MTGRPVIAVPWPRPDYVRALERAGADVRALDPAADPPRSALDAVDGLMLTGGSDVNPAEYGESVRHASVHVDPDRDRYELPLARVALERGLPVLAICRGMQALNVAAGGTLIQDLPSEHASDVPHKVPDPSSALAHRVVVRPDSCLAGLLRPRLETSQELVVNSRHHQAVKGVAPGFEISAVAPDGVVEGIERAAGGFCVGVQWHPENFDGGEFASVFDGFVDAARAYRHARLPA